VSFANALQRLRDAEPERQAGTNPRSCIVRREDLRELLHHFDRLDGEVRNFHAASSAGEKR
jgi:hypothetical protein